MDPVCSEESDLRIIHKEAKTASCQNRRSPNLHERLAMRIADEALCPVLPVKRHRELLRLLRVRGQLTVREVANHFKISVDTARRDLDLLARQGVLNRTYGGAVAPEGSAPQGRKRSPRIASSFEKTRLAQSLGQLIEDGETLVLNGGFTTRCCVEALGGRDVRMVTNSLDIPFDFITGAEVCVLGGKCRLDARVTTGPMIISGKNINADSAVIAVDGITAEEGLSANLLEEALMASEMIAAAQRTIVVADSSRFGKRSFAHIGPIESMQVLITDEEPPPDLAHALREAHVQVVIIAPQEVGGSLNGHLRRGPERVGVSFHPE
jgi:DeoR family transcriptional regulator, fructose operon transcriptional repressor